VIRCEKNPFPGTASHWTWLLSHIDKNEQTWANRHGISSRQQNSSFMDFGIPGVGSIPGVVTGPGAFTVQVNQVTWKRVRTPAVGATVTFGAASATTAADGTATFGATSGVATIRATRRGAIAATKQLCVEGTNPVCGG
jgi:hypothetical protein